MIVKELIEILEDFPDCIIGGVIEILTDSTTVGEFKGISVFFDGKKFLVEMDPIPNEIPKERRICQDFDSYEINKSNP